MCKQVLISAIWVGLVVYSDAGCGMAQDEISSWQAPVERVQALMAQQSTFNYFEDRVPDYQLPDPLLLQNGDPITTAEDWYTKRRPELLELFREHVYGRRPTTEPNIRYEPLDVPTPICDGQATAQTIRMVIGIDDREFSLEFELVLPTEASRLVPAVVFINNRYRIPVEKLRDETDEFWPVADLVERGYATASFFTSDLDPDRADGYATGIRAFFAAGNAPEDDAWRSLSAWGWGASRVLDYLETLEQVDARQVAVVGHSRGGKTALWAVAEDPRFAIAYSNQSGCGGASLSRRNYGETVGRITSVFPHWFVPKFASYAEREGELPIDQHLLMALIAPRAIYVASADEDLWADPRGEYMSLVAASPVFKLLQMDSLSDSEMPPLEQPRIAGATGYHIRRGQHSLNAEDWRRFLDFANIQFERR